MHLELEILLLGYYCILPSQVEIGFVVGLAHLCNCSLNFEIYTANILQL